MPLLLAYAIPAAKARARRLEAESTPPALPDPRLYEELDGLRARVGELEERLDFTERMLAQQQDRSRLPAEK